MLPYMSTSPRLLDSEVGAVRSSLNVGKYLPVYTAYQPTRFLFNNQPDALIIQIYSVKKKLYIFRASSLPIIRSFLLYPSRVRMELQFHPDSVWKLPSKTCMKLTSAEDTVEKS